MLKFSIKPIDNIKVGNKNISVFDLGDENIDKKTVESFGEEWSKFNSFSDVDLNVTGDEYFDIIPDHIYKDKKVLDAGCGTGRWSKYISAKASEIEAVDPSAAVFSAASVLQDCDNARVSQASIANLPFADNSFDFVFSLGVLHHIPDTQNAMSKCVHKVKPGGFFLVYLYYSLDNRGVLFRSIPLTFKKLVSPLILTFVSNSGGIIILK